MSFHTKLEHVLAQGELSPKQNKDLIKLIKTSGLPYKDLILEAGMNLYLSGKLENDNSRYLILEAMLEAALKTRNWPTYYVEQKLPGYRIVTLQNLRKGTQSHTHQDDALKSLKSYNMTEKRLDILLKDNLADQEALKAKISIKIAQGDLHDAITNLNSYLQMNPVDREAWLELFDIYMNLQDHAKALFCLEEVLLITPDNLHIITKIAELNYTIGKKENLKVAKKYFSFVLLNHEENVRALWGLKYTGYALKEVGETDAEKETTEKLLSLVESRMESIYKHLNTKEYLK